MKLFLFIFCILLTLSSWIGAGIWFGWYYPKTYNYALRLADDSSLPSQKKEYLQEYLNQVGNITGSVAYVFKRPDYNLDKQRTILSGLIQRLDDINKLQPSEMAYQQGMAQINEEMEHQLGRISSLFQSAKLRQNPLLFLLFCVIGIISIIGWVVYGIKRLLDY